MDANNIFYPGMLTEDECVAALGSNIWSTMLALHHNFKLYITEFIMIPPAPQSINRSYKATMSNDRGLPIVRVGYETRYTKQKQSKGQMIYVQRRDFIGSNTTLIESANSRYILKHVCNNNGETYKAIAHAIKVADTIIPNKLKEVSKMYWYQRREDFDKYKYSLGGLDADEQDAALQILSGEKKIEEFPDEITEAILHMNKTRLQREKALEKFNAIGTSLFTGERWVIFSSRDISDKSPSNNRRWFVGAVDTTPLVPYATGQLPSHDGMSLSETVPVRIYKSLHDIDPAYKSLIMGRLLVFKLSRGAPTSMDADGLIPGGTGVWDDLGIASLVEGSNSYLLFPK